MYRLLFGQSQLGPAIACDAAARHDRLTACLSLRLKMFSRRTQRNPCQPPRDWKDQLVDVRVVKQPEDDVERIALILRTVRVRSDRDVYKRQLSMCAAEGSSYSNSTGRLNPGSTRKPLSIRSAAPGELLSLIHI